MFLIGIGASVFIISLLTYGVLWGIIEVNDFPAYSYNRGTYREKYKKKLKKMLYWGWLPPFAIYFVELLWCCAILWQGQFGSIHAQVHLAFSTIVVAWFVGTCIALRFRPPYEQFKKRKRAQEQASAEARIR